jgi:hypothetical protein
MRKYCLALLLILSTSQYNYSQVFCIPTDQPKYPELARRNGLSISFRVRFDVVRFIPQNTRISELDTTKNQNNTIVEMFSPSIIDYLHQLCFQKDIKDYLLRINFQVKPRGLISTGYVEKVSENEISIIDRSAKRSGEPNINQCICDSVLRANQALKLTE